MRKQKQYIQGEILTVLRRQGVSAMSAYEILAELREEHPKIAPTTIYRALDALIQQGRVLRLESLNAFISCQFDQRRHTSILSICDDCGIVNEKVSADVVEGLSRFIGKSGCAPTHHVIEVHGLCAICKSEEVSA